MNGPDEAAGKSTELPYPHTRNDCGMCRERDADVELIEEPAPPAHFRPTLLCQDCLGKVLAMRVVLNSGDDFTTSSTFTLVVASGRR
jgi:hypothetical protein